MSAGVGKQLIAPVAGPHSPWSPSLHWLRNGPVARSSFADGGSCPFWKPERSPPEITPSRIRSVLSRSIALWIAVARWRAPDCRYPSLTRLVMTADKRNRSLKADYTAHCDIPQFFPATPFS
jgi:hypothetical protein